jgi:hypothetical protein
MKEAVVKKVLNIADVAVAEVITIMDIFSDAS